VRYTIEDMPPETEVGEIRIRAFEGGDVYTRFIDLPAGTDFTPLFVGLPGDLCQCAHWGHVVEGSITVRYADGTEETNRAGDVFYWPAGHTGWTDTGVKFLEISPSADIFPVLDHLSKQLAG
jgi:hypothetical protein